MEFSSPCEFEQLLVGGRIPEEIGEPRGHRKVVERARLLDDAEEVGRREQVADLVEHDLAHAAARLDVGLDRGHDRVEFVVREIAAEESRRDPADRFFHDREKCVGLHRLELGDRPRRGAMPPAFADLAQFLVEVRRKIGRQPAVADRGHVQGLHFDPLHGQARFAFLGGGLCLAALWHGLAEAEGYEPDAIPNGGLVVHIGAAEIDIGLDDVRLAGRCIEDCDQFNQLRIGADVAGVDAEGQRLVGLEAVDREPDFVETGRATAKAFEQARRQIRIERDECLVVEFQVKSSRDVVWHGLVPLERRRLRGQRPEQPPHDPVGEPHGAIDARGGEGQGPGHLLIAVHAAVLRQIDRHRRAEPEDVEDRIGVFLAGEPTQLAPADLLLVLPLERGQIATDPFRDLGPFLGRGLLLLLGRHPARFDLVEGAEPGIPVGRHEPLVGPLPVELHARLRLLAPVAAGAAGLDDARDIRRHAGQRGANASSGPDDHRKRSDEPHTPHCKPPEPALRRLRRTKPHCIHDSVHYGQDTPAPQLPEASSWICQMPGVRGTEADSWERRRMPSS